VRRKHDGDVANLPVLSDDTFQNHVTLQGGRDRRLGVVWFYLVSDLRLDDDIGDLRRRRGHPRRLSQLFDGDCATDVCGRSRRRHILRSLRSRTG